MNDVTAAAETIANADRFVAMTGAGVSTPSGVPDFRGEDGLWERYDPDAFHVRRLERDPAAFWERWLDLLDGTFRGGRVEPNPAHEALADLESAGHLDAILTQNVDGLHQAAGSEAVLELHGTHDEVECRGCGSRFDADPAVERARDGELPPRCRRCDGLLEPASVLFGEPLPRDVLWEARGHAERCDVFLVAGSSLTVEPAASLPARAARGGATLLVANADATPHDELAAHVFRGDVADVLPAIRDALRDRRRREPPS